MEPLSEKTLSTKPAPPRLERFRYLQFFSPRLPSSSFISTTAGTTSLIFFFLMPESLAQLQRALELESAPN